MTIDDFRVRYEGHVGRVAAGDTRSALADIVPETIPGIFEGVAVPGKDVTDVRIVDVRADGDRRVGEAVYTTPQGRIGLRSIWVWRDDAWLAAVLENFPVEEQS